MSKWYEVKVTTIKVVLVEVEEEETEQLTSASALDAVMEEKFTDGEVEAAIDGGPYEEGSQEWASAKRHADEVLAL